MNRCRYGAIAVLVSMLPVAGVAATVSIGTPGTRLEISGFIVQPDGTSVYGGFNGQTTNFTFVDGELRSKRNLKGAISDVRITQPSNVPDDYTPLGALNVYMGQTLTTSGVSAFVTASYDYFDSPYMSPIGAPVGPPGISSLFTYVIRAPQDATLDVAVKRAVDGGDFVPFDAYSIELEAGERQMLFLRNSWRPESFFQDASATFEINVSMAGTQLGFTPKPVPLPAGGLLLLTGVLAAFGLTRRNRPQGGPRIN